MSPELPADAEFTAAELAFGLLDAPEQRQAEERVAADPAFADAVARWAAHAAAMAAGAGEPPPPSLWAAIAARLPANDIGADGWSPPTAAPRPRWGRAFLAGALAASLACGLIALAAQRTYDLVPAAAAQARMAGAMAAERQRMQAALVTERKRARVMLVAVLTGSGRRDSVTISFDPATGKLVSAPVALGVGAGAAELWVIPADGTPRSLGVIAAAAPGMPRPRAGSAAVLAPGVTVAVSLEPAGGSPRSTPTGPVILTGKMTPI
jgi:anti-sigma-K factor RskA